MLEQLRTRESFVRLVSWLTGISGESPIAPCAGIKSDGAVERHSPKSSALRSQSQNARRWFAYAPSHTERVAKHLVERMLYKVLAKQQKKELDRRLAIRRRRPLDRRAQLPESFEDKKMSGSVSFAEHESGLTITARFYWAPPVVVELNERSSRVLCYYLAYKIEGGPALGPKWDDPVSFHDKSRTSFVTFAEYEDGLSISAESSDGSDALIKLDNWYSIALGRYLIYKVEGHPYRKK